MRVRVAIMLAGCCSPGLGLLGCGAAAPDCAATSSFLLTVEPAATPALPAGVATADHRAKPPGNQVQFLASSRESNSDPHCASTALAARVYAKFSVSDNVDVQVSSASDNTNGLATCVGPTTEPATITASYTVGTQTKTAIAQLFCQ